MAVQGELSEVQDGVGMVDPSEVVIRALASEADRTAFRMLNEEWITRYFVLEEQDRATLGDPEGKILSRGGHILIAQLGGHAVGCVALIPTGEHVYELSKMAVSPTMRGIGIGRKLLEQAVAQAKLIGARSLWLGSNSRLANAVHLYESVGFAHVPVERRPASLYARADVFMELHL